MAFLVRQPETIDLEVVVKLPDGEKRTFTITAKYLGMKERKALLEELNNTEIQDIDLLKRLVTGWNDVHDEGGNDIPFNASNLERVADIPFVFDGLVSAIIAEYLNVVPGILQPSVRKN